MKPAPVFLIIGYGLGAILGLCLGIWLGHAGNGSLFGMLTAWLAGGFFSIVVAFGWYRGLWLHSVLPAKGSDLPVAEDHEFEQWDADLASEQFETDLIADRAQDVTKEIGKDLSGRATG